MLIDRFERLHNPEPPAPGHADAADDLPIGVLKGNSTGKRYEVAIGELNSMRICPCFAVVVQTCVSISNRRMSSPSLWPHRSLQAMLHPCDEMLSGGRPNQALRCKLKFRVRPPSYGSLHDSLRLLRRNLHALCSFGSTGRLGDHSIKSGQPAGPAPAEFGKAFPMYNWNHDKHESGCSRLSGSDPR